MFNLVGQKQRRQKVAWKKYLNCSDQELSKALKSHDFKKLYSLIRINSKEVISWYTVII